MEQVKGRKCPLRRFESVKNEVFRLPGVKYRGVHGAENATTLEFDCGSNETIRDPVGGAVVEYKKTRVFPALI